MSTFSLHQSYLSNYLSYIKGSGEEFLSVEQENYFAERAARTLSEQELPVDITLVEILPPSCVAFMRLVVLTKKTLTSLSKGEKVPFVSLFLLAAGYEVASLTTVDFLLSFKADPELILTFWRVFFEGDPLLHLEEDKEWLSYYPLLPRPKLLSDDALRKLPTEYLDEFWRAYPEFIQLLRCFDLKKNVNAQRVRLHRECQKLIVRVSRTAKRGLLGICLLLLSRRGS